MSKWNVKLKDYVNENLPSVLSGAAVVGVIVTVGLTIEATLKAKSKLDKMKNEPLNEKALAIVPLCLAPAVAGGATVCCILGADRENKKRYLAIASALELSKGQFSNYKKQVSEIIGKEKSDEIDKEAKSQAITQVNGKTRKGVEEILDLVTGIRFVSSQVAILKAQSRINSMAILDGSARLSDFYEYLGVETDVIPEIADKIRWSASKGIDQMNIEFGGLVTDNGEMLMTINYEYDIDNEH